MVSSPSVSFLSDIYISLGTGLHQLTCILVFFSAPEEFMNFPEVGILATPDLGSHIAAGDTEKHNQKQWNAHVERDKKHIYIYKSMNRTIKVEKDL